MIETTPEAESSRPSGSVGPARSVPAAVRGARARDYLAALGVSALGIALWSALPHLVGGSPTILFLVVPVLFAAAYGGLGPGALATAVGALWELGSWLSADRPSPTPGAEAVRMVVFVGVGLAVSALHETRLRDRRSLARRLRELQTLFEVSPVPIAVTDDPECRSLSVNRPFAELLGTATPGGGSPGAEPPFRLLRDGRELEASELPMRQCMATGREIHGFELDVVRRDGRTFRVVANAAPLFDERRQVRGAIAACMDITERERAERRLREEEARLRLVTDAAPVAIAQLDLEHRYRFVNRAYAARFGLEPARIVGRTIPEVLGEEAHALLRPRVDETLAGRRVEFDADVSYPALGRRHVRCVYEPHRDADGRVVGYVAAIADITDRKLLEDSLRESEGRLRVITDNAPVYLAQLDLEHRFRFVNRANARRFGLEPEDFVGRTAREMIGDAAFEAIQRRIAPVLREGRRVEFDEEIDYRAIGKQYMRCVYEPARDEAGRIVGYVGLTVNITDRKRLEDSLRESEGRLAAIVDHSPSAIFAKDRAGRYLLANHALAEIVGRPLEEIAGRTDRDFFEPELAERFAAADAAILESGETRVYEETVQVRGRAYTTLTAKFPLLDADGRPYAVCGVATDITERKRAEESLREADRRKDEFLATLAHELRNPLAPVRNALHVLRLGGADAESVRALMERQIGQMARLIDDLLDVSRVTRGKLELRRRWVSLREVVDDAIETARPVIDAAGSELVVDLPLDGVFLDADPTRLAQVFGNLLNNAAKYGEPGARIRLSASREGDEVVVRVADEGVGIPPDMLDAVFDLFVQVDRSLERSRGGLGIGLTLAKRLVEMHGGTIEARSDGPGRGAELVVRLPAVEVREPEARPAEPAALGGEPQGLKILVVDDNEDSAESLGLLFEITGNRIERARDGVAALERAAEFRPDVVLLDIGLPLLNGYEVARRMRQEPWGREAVLIAVTGWGQEDDRRRAADAGFDGHLTKPVDPAAVLKAVADLAAADARGTRRPLPEPDSTIA